MDFIRPLGATGIHVSAIGLGTVKIGRNTAVKYPRPFALPSDDQVAALLRTAADLDVNLIDTAPAYGVSEQRLGDTLARLDWLGARDRWVLCTKAGEELGVHPDGSTASRFDFSAAAVHASVMRSLQRLRTDYLDVVLIHSDGRDEAIIADRAAIDALQTLKSRGLVRAIGISIKSPAGGRAALGIPDPGNTSLPRSSSWCDVLMCTLNQSHLDELPLIRAAHRLGVGVLIKKALQSGHAAVPPASPPRDSTPAVFGPAANPLAFVLRQAGDAASSIVVGTLNPEHLRHNAAVATRVSASGR